MDMIFNLETLVALQNVLTALGALMIAARPVAAAFRILAKLTPWAFDDAIASGLTKFLNLFAPKGK